jgi:hypothetical protein
MCERASLFCRSVLHILIACILPSIFFFSDRSKSEEVLTRPWNHGVLFTHAAARCKRVLPVVQHRTSRPSGIWNMPDWLQQCCSCMLCCSWRHIRHCHSWGGYSSSYRGLQLCSGSLHGGMCCRGLRAHAMTLCCTYVGDVSPWALVTLVC